MDFGIRDELGQVRWVMPISSHFIIIYDSYTEVLFIVTYYVTVPLKLEHVHRACAACFNELHPDLYQQADWQAIHSLAQ